MKRDQNKKKKKIWTNLKDFFLLFSALEQSGNVLPSCVILVAKMPTKTVPRTCPEWGLFWSIWNSKKWTEPRMPVKSDDAKWYYVCSGCSLSDKYILSPINPKYWFCQIYKQLQLNLHETDLLSRYLSHHFTWHCLLIYGFPQFYQFLFVEIIKLLCTDIYKKKPTTFCANSRKSWEISRNQ